MQDIDYLIEQFRKLPGVGKSQARSFCYFFLNEKKGAENFIETLKEIKNSFRQCSLCFRFISKKENEICSICQDNNRENKLIVIANDFLIKNFEKTEIKYFYFVLGGKIKNYNFNENDLRIKELENYIEKRKPTEIILAFDLTREGEITSNFLKTQLEKYKIKISTLARGIAFGSEIIYSDIETIKNSIKNRN